MRLSVLGLRLRVLNRVQWGLVDDKIWWLTLSLSIVSLKTNAKLWRNFYKGEICYDRVIATKWGRNKLHQPGRIGPGSILSYYHQSGLINPTSSIRLHRPGFIGLDSIPSYSHQPGLIRLSSVPSFLYQSGLINQASSTRPYQAWLHTLITSSNGPH